MLGWPLRTFFKGFNWTFNGLATGYGWLTGRLVRLSFLVLIAYAGLVGLAIDEFSKAPRGFIPQQERGFYIIAVQLPPGAALSRTDEVVKRATEIVLATPGFDNAVGIVGFSGATFTSAPNAAAIFARTEDIASLADRGLTQQRILGSLFQRLAPIQEAFIIPIAPPPVQGVGNAGGVRMMVQDRAGLGSAALADALQAMSARAAQDPAIERPFFTFETRTPQLFLDIDRVKAQMLGINLTEAFRTLEIYLGSAYVNDFNFLGKTFRVTAQADGGFRNDPADILRLRVRNQSGDSVPFASFAQLRETAGPARVPRYNLYPAAEFDASTPQGYSSGQTMAAMERIAREVLPPGMSFEWTGIAWQQQRAGDTGLYAFILGVVFVFLVLAAQYESLTLPLAVILIVPMCLLAGVAGVVFRGLDVNVLTQIGFVVLIGLAAKKRHPHRRVRAPARGQGPRRARGGDAGGAVAPAPDRDDVARLHPGRRAARDSERGGGGDAPGHRHGGVLRHAGRDRLRPLVHAHLLRPLQPAGCAVQPLEAGRFGSATRRARLKRDGRP